MRKGIDRTLQWLPQWLTGAATREGVGSLITRGVHIPLQLLVVVILGRELGPEAYGLYAFWLAIATVLAMPAKIGGATLATRFTALYMQRNAYTTMGKLWRWQVRWTAVYGFSLFVVIAALAMLAIDQQATAHSYGLIFSALGLMALMPYVEIFGGIIRGLNHTVIGQAPELLLRPGLFLILLFAVPLLGLETILPTSASSAMALHLCATVLAALTAALLVRAYRPEPDNAGVEEEEPRRWASTLARLSLIGGLQVLNAQADAIMLGILVNPEAVGLYRIAVQGSILVLAVSVAIIMIVEPVVVRLHAAGQITELQRLARQAAWAIFAVSAAMGLPIIAFSSEILTGVFGAQYAAADGVLIALTAGQLASTAFGPVAMLLTMTGHEKATVLSVGLAAVLNLTLNALLIPFMGMAGAAIASISSLLTSRTMMYFIVRRRLGINPGIFKLPDHRTRGTQGPE